MMKSVGLVIVLLAGMVFTPLAADDSKHIVIDKPWARASAGNAPNGAVYMTLRNTGERPDRVLGGSSPVAGQVQVHNTVRKNNVMRMRPVDNLEVPAGGSTALAPGGLHIMLMGLKSPLKQGTTVRISLEFERAGKVAVDIPVYGPGSPGPDK